MKHHIPLILTAIAGALTTASCASTAGNGRHEAPLTASSAGSTRSEAPQTATGATPVPVHLGGNNRITGGVPEPAAVVYRTNGDYADNVPVSVNAAGQLLSYPAPSDLPGSEPIPVADGYLLDRRGIGPNTVFTRYTYATYSALPQAPAPDSIMAAIIPGARITTSVTLPMTLSGALADTAAVNTYIRTHLSSKP